MLNPPIRYGLVGLGRAGWDIHVAALRGRTDAKVAAVVDPLPERRGQATAELGCRAYATLPEMLEAGGIDVAVVATPSAMHAADAATSLKKGFHTVVEKPIGISLQEADQLIATARASGRQLFVHQNYRFSPDFIHLQEVIASGVLGRIFHIRHYSTAFARRNDWQTLARHGGGLLNNHGTHALDQILQLIIPGRITQVMADMQQIASAGDAEDHVKAFMRTDADCTIDLEISTAQNLPQPLPKWIICGTTGTLTSNAVESTIRWFDPAAAPPLAPVDGPAANRAYGNTDQLPWQEKIGPAVGTSRGTFYDDVARALRDNAPPYITVESVRELMRVLAMIRAGTRFE